jgi:uncharacterized protein YdbL (DUF1318 family)
VIARRTLLLAAAALAAGCQPRNASLPPAPARVARPWQQLEITNAVAERIAADEQAARTGDARAQTIAELKDGQQLAEDRQGYLRPAGAAPSAQAAAAVAQENADRRLHYQALAKEQALPLDMVEAIAGDARISGERPGRLVLDAAGAPVRKE